MKIASRHLAPVLLALVLPVAFPSAVQAAESGPTGISAEIRRDLDAARSEVGAELAESRRELQTGNLRIDNSLHFESSRSASTREAKRLPRAEITPQGDLLIAGRKQVINAVQRQQLLAYRSQVVEIALTGLDIGQRSAEAALQAVGDTSLAGLMVGAMSGQLERRIERVVSRELEPAVRGICRQLPAVMASQQQLASSLPQFRPYATLAPADIRDCETQIRQDFAAR